MELLKYSKLNENINTTKQNSWNVTNLVVQEKSIALIANFREKKKSEIKVFILIN